MAEYIEREELKKVFSNEAVHCLTFQKKGEARGLIKAREIVSKLPTADVAEVKHGKWVVNAWDGKDWTIIPYKEGQHTDPFCSCCKEPAMRGSRSGRYETSNYCPYCGAKMDGKDINVPTIDGERRETDAE